MTKLLLSGVAVLFLATGTAHANDQLPEHILGRWCSGPFVSTRSQKVYFRPYLKEDGRKTCSDMTDGIMIDQEGYEDEGPWDDAPKCSFDNIKREDRDTCFVHVHCTASEQGEIPSFEGGEEFQLVNGLLFKKRMPEG